MTLFGTRIRMRSACPTNPTKECETASMTTHLMPNAGGVRSYACCGTLSLVLLGLPL
jgi:hypothetical protein